MSISFFSTFKRCRIFGLFVFALSVSANGSAEPASSTEDWERREILVDANALGEIESSLEKGRWSNDGFNGALKFIITKNGNGTNKIYVQWLNDEDGSVAYTVSVREFNIAPEFQLDLPECLKDDCTLSKIKARHVYEEVEQTFVLNLVGLGRYSVGLFKQ